MVIITNRYNYAYRKCPTAMDDYSIISVLTKGSLLLLLVSNSKQVYAHMLKITCIYFLFLISSCCNQVTLMVFYKHFML